MRKILTGLLALGAVIMSHPVLAQQPGCLTNSPPCTQLTNFIPSGAASLTVSSVSSNIAFPSAGSTLVALLTNQGAVPIYYRAGNNTVTATTADKPVFPGQSVPLPQGTSTNIAAVTATGTATLAIQSGTGSPTIVYGGGGSSGGGFPTLGANQIIGAVVGGPAIPLAVPSCSASTSGLIWQSGVGFGCNAFGTASLAATGTIGHTLPYLDGANIWSDPQSYAGASSGNLGSFGATSAAEQARMSQAFDITTSRLHYFDNINRNFNPSKSYWQQNITCIFTTGSAIVTGCNGTTGAVVGNYLQEQTDASGNQIIPFATNFPAGTTIASGITSTGFTMSANALTTGAKVVSIVRQCGNAADIYYPQDNGLPGNVFEAGAIGYSVGPGCTGAFKATRMGAAGNVIEYGSMYVAGTSGGSAGPAGVGTYYTDIVISVAHTSNADWYPGAAWEPVFVDGQTGDVTLRDHLDATVFRYSEDRNEFRWDGMTILNQPGVNTVMERINHSDLTQAFIFSSDNSRFPKFQGWTNTTSRFVLEGYYQSQLTPGNYATCGALRIAATNSANACTGYGLYIDSASATGAAYFTGATVTTGLATFSAPLDPNGSVLVNSSISNPTGRSNAINSNNLITLTSDNAQDAQAIIGQLYVNAKTHAATGQHIAGTWGQAIALGDDPAGTYTQLNGVAGVAYNAGQGTVTQTNDFFARSPVANITNGHVTKHYGFFEETYANDGTFATNVYGASFVYPVGVGTRAPTGLFHATGSANSNVNGLMLENASAGSAASVDVQWKVSTGAITGYMRSAYDAVQGFHFKFGAGLGPVDTMSLTNPTGANGGRLGIAIGATLPAYTIDAGGDINSTGVYRVSGTAGLASKVCITAGATITITGGLITATSGC